MLPDPANVHDRQELHDGATRWSPQLSMDGARDAFAASSCTGRWDGYSVGDDCERG